MPLRGWLRIPSASGPRWAWALLLALVLPLAQGAAARHAVAHHGAPAHERDAAPNALDTTCAQCLLSAPVGAGALPPTTPAFTPPQTAHAAPKGARLVQAAGAPALAYRSRAPPASSH
ncbi:MAG: hypothetical protein KIT60_08965 [Burkholderiaceae bacterium]|nr:hypothetical protein [Burkholderiaceae bacterium]